MMKTGWTRGRLMHLLDGLRDGTHGSFQRVDEGTPFLSAKNVRETGLRIGHESLISNEDAKSVVSSGYPARGDVLLTIVGTVGRSAVYDLDESIPFQRSVAFLRPGSRLESRFLSFALQSEYVQDQMRLATKTSAQPGLYLGEVAALSLLWPPLDEQTAIADYLDRETERIDELIAEQRGLIETLRERRRGATLSLLSGLDVGGDRWSSDSFVFPSLPAGWGTVALGRIGDSKSGSGFPPAHQGQQGRELQFYKVKHLGLADGADVINGADDTISRETAVSLRAHVFPAGTIVYAKVGAALMLGRIRTLGAEGCIDNNMAGFTPFDVADSRYVQLAMSAIPFDYLVNPGAVPSLSDKKLMAMKIPFPSPQVRHAIARSIDHQTSRIDALIAESEDLIALSLERRAALITAAVTGQIDVRTAA